MFIYKNKCYNKGRVALIYYIRGENVIKLLSVVKSVLTLLLFYVLVLAVRFFSLILIMIFYYIINKKNFTTIDELFKVTNLTYNNHNNLLYVLIILLSMIIYLNILPGVRKNIYNKTAMSINNIKSFKLVMLGLSTGLFISFLVNAIPLPEYISMGLSIVKDISILELIFRLFGTVILVPIVEEVLFRGVLLDKISDKIPSVFAILISSIAFSFFHNDYVQMIYTFIMGIIFAITYLKVKNIFAPIIVHIIYNFTSVTYSYINYIPFNTGILIIVFTGFTSVLLVSNIINIKDEVYK